MRLELTHFPIDDTFASVVAKEVNAAVGAGFVLPTGLSGITCDVNSSSDTSVPADTSLDPGDWDIPADGSFDIDVTELQPTDLDDMPESSIDDLSLGGIGGLDGFGDGGNSNAAEGNPENNNDNQLIPGISPPALTSDGDINNPKQGDTLTAPSICEGGEIIFYRVDPSAPDGRVIAAQATSTYTMIINDVDRSVYAEIRCPDPTSPDGYGEPIRTAITPTISPGCIDIPGITYNGTVPPPGNTTGAEIILANSGIVTQEYFASPNDCTAALFPPYTFGASSVTLQDVKDIELVSVAGSCGNTKQLLWRVTYANNTVEDRNIVNLGDTRGFAEFSTSVTTTWSGPGAVTYCP